MKRISTIMAFLIVFAIAYYAIANQVSITPYEIDVIPTTLSGGYRIFYIVWENAQAGDTITLKYRATSGGPWVEIIDTTAAQSGTDRVPLYYSFVAYDFTVVALTHGSLRVSVGQI